MNPPAPVTIASTLPIPCAPHRAVVRTGEAYTARGRSGLLEVGRGDQCPYRVGGHRFGEVEALAVLEAEDGQLRGLRRFLDTLRDRVQVQHPGDPDHGL